jgi:hypothetical protein
MTPMQIMIANLAAATIMHDDPELRDYLDLDNYDRAELVRDYRDEFASSPFPPLADAKIDDEMINAITDVLDAILAS